jgi:hypothetical protein
MIPPYFALTFVGLDRIVMRRGWNLCLHGSMGRDLDLVLIPWVEDADHIDKVIDDIRVFVEGKYVARKRRENNKKTGSSQEEGLARYVVQEKPHGRKAISIYIGSTGYYLDISIMPRLPVTPPEPST